jgi:hypothetical protein
MVLHFTGKQVNTSYSSEQMLIMLFLCNSWDSHPTIIFKPNGSFCRPASTIHLAEISTAKTLRNEEVKMKIPKSDKVTLRRRTEGLSI